MLAVTRVEPLVSDFGPVTCLMLLESRDCAHTFLSLPDGDIPCLFHMSLLQRADGRHDLDPFVSLKAMSALRVRPPRFTGTKKSRGAVPGRAISFDRRELCLVVGYFFSVLM